MIQGQWPEQGCHYCQKQENGGGISDRQFQLIEQRDPGLTPPELHTDSTSTSVTPTMLEVYFRNTCNQKCIYCSPTDSSLWEKEIEQFGIMPEQSKSQFDMYADLPYIGEDEYKRALANMWDYLDGIYLHLRRFGIVGGEPFLQQTEMDQSIDFWQHHPNPDLVFNIISNLNLPEKVMSRYYEKFRGLVENQQVWMVQITASLDGWGPEQEYTRFGLDLETWQNNFEKLVAESWSTVSINSTISALTIHTMPELMRRIKHWNSMRPPGTNPIIYSFNTPSGSPDDPVMFGGGIFDRSFDEVLDLMPSVTESDRNIRDHMLAIKKKIAFARRNQSRIDNLKSYLDKLDQRRGTDWRATFSWLAAIE